MDDFGVMGLASLAEMNYLRLEAMDLFERCLTEGSTIALEIFIEEQIACDPPWLELLREVSEDLHQRLMALRQDHLDITQRVWGTLRDDFGLSAPDHTRQIDAQQLIERIRLINPTLSPGEKVMLHKMLETSLAASHQLYNDILMTEKLYGYLIDWVEGLNATFARRFWTDRRGDYAPEGVH